MNKKKALLTAILLLIGVSVVFGVATLIQKGNFNDQGRASSGNVMVGKLVRATDKVCTKCVEQCPGKDNVLRNCNPMESDGTSMDSTCNAIGRKELCGGQTYCCPSVGGKWTTDLTKCRGVEKTIGDSKQFVPNEKTIRVGEPTPGRGRVVTKEPTKSPMPTNIPSDYRLLRDGGACSALVINRYLAEPFVGKKVTLVGSLKEPYFYVSKISENTCKEECPGKDGVLRNCTPPEADGTSEDSLCNQAGRRQTCGGVMYCCPDVSGVWTKDMTKCPKSITPTPSPKTSITPTSVISPSVNSLPVFTGSRLERAAIGKPYSQTIYAVDADTADVLTMTATSLPTGFTLGSCKYTGFAKNAISCVLSGTPSTTGNLPVLLVATDSKGGKTSQSYILTVL